MYNPSRLIVLKQSFFIIFICAFLVSCAIAPLKNSEFYEAALSTSEDLDTLLIGFKTKKEKIKYEGAQEDYNKIESSMNKMVMLARLDDSNEGTIEIAEAIRQDFLDMIALHIKEKQLNPAYFGSKQIAYEGLFFSLLKSENAKPER